MSETAADNYAIYYADKLWTLLPAIYRTLDTDQFASAGPLRELVNRIGDTAATLRRSMDRLWDDQSIETCDDWVIPYIAALLDTKLVLGLDARGQRLDVANTIDYRRRKGTIGVLEQIANDITGWDAKAVEFFRRLARSRHGLDPPIGPYAAAGSAEGILQRAEGLVGTLTKTRIGGFADLRHVEGAKLSRTAFDEYFHTADLRAGQGLFGWQNIPHLGFFVWRLISQQVGPVTPVAVQNCPGWFCFDPTGRNIPLFAPPRASTDFGDLWISPEDGQMPGPITQALLDDDLRRTSGALQLYPNAMSVWRQLSLSPLDRELVKPDPKHSSSDLLLRPERGQFYYTASPPAAASPLLGKYHYGFPSLIGAGPFDRRGQAVTMPSPAPPLAVAGGGAALASGLPGSGTVTVQDSLTYEGAADLSVTGTLTLRAANNQRPLIRLHAATPWTITSAAPDARLGLDGLFVSGQDIILAGDFASVTLTCCTLDPGSASAIDLLTDPATSPPPALFLAAADGRALAPTRLWITGAVQNLTIDRCVLGPIRARTPGNVETTTISNSTVQAIRTAGLGGILPADVKDPARLLRRLQLELDPVSKALAALVPAIKALLGPLASPPLSAATPPPDDLSPLLGLLNPLLAGPSLYGAAFAKVPLSAGTMALMRAVRPNQPATACNRLLLEDAYPLELADAALAFADGTLNLSRCTVIGRVQAHRLQASECILLDLTLVDDLQDGCVRFTAWAKGSQLPRQYESVSIPQAAPLFTTTAFGQPGYAQLVETADRLILPQTHAMATPQNTISAGAQDGSEMGAYARDKNPIRAMALALKLLEYMPANLTPTIINVT